jgi:hypothetical protein
MARKSLDAFGLLLMRRVRDEAILDWDMILDGRMKSPRAQRIRQDLAVLDERALSLISALVPRIVDTTLHHLLWILEQEKSLRLEIKTDNETTEVSSLSDGLPGELYSSDGWIARFSQQRHEES